MLPPPLKKVIIGYTLLEISISVNNFVHFYLDAFKYKTSTFDENMFSDVAGVTTIF